MKIIGYCPCCGEPHYENVSIAHDSECVWYEEFIVDGDDQDSTGGDRIRVYSSSKERR